MNGKKIFVDDNNGDHWIADSEADCIDKIVDSYGVSRDEIRLREIPGSETVELIVIDDTFLQKKEIPDGGTVGWDWDNEHLFVEATAKQWLAHLEEHGWMDPWLVGTW